MIPTPQYRNALGVPAWWRIEWEGVASRLTGTTMLRAMSRVALLVSIGLRIKLHLKLAQTPSLYVSPTIGTKSDSNISSCISSQITPGVPNHHQ